MSVQLDVSYGALAKHLGSGERFKSFYRLQSACIQRMLDDKRLHFQAKKTAVMQLGLSVYALYKAMNKCNPKVLRRDMDRDIASAAAAASSATNEDFLSRSSRSFFSILFELDAAHNRSCVLIDKMGGGARPSTQSPAAKQAPAAAKVARPRFGVEWMQVGAGLKAGAIGAGLAVDRGQSNFEGVAEYIAAQTPADVPSSSGIEAFDGVVEYLKTEASDEFNEKGGGETNGNSTNADSGEKSADESNAKSNAATNGEKSEKSDMEMNDWSNAATKGEKSEKSDWSNSGTKNGASTNGTNARSNVATTGGESMNSSNHEDTDDPSNEGDGSSGIVSGPGYDSGFLLTVDGDSSAMLASGAMQYVEEQQFVVFVVTDIPKRLFGTAKGVFYVVPPRDVMRLLPDWAWLHGNFLFIGAKSLTPDVKRRLATAVTLSPKVSILLSAKESNSLTEEAREALLGIVEGKV
jgi:hypothetical protein